MRTTRIALVALSMVLFASGCAWRDPGQGRVLACGQATCTVPVAVRDCRVQVDEFLQLGSAPDRVRIVWTIQGPGEFHPREGIDFRGNPRVGEPARGAKRWEVTFDNRAKGTRHKYDVNITGCPAHDPFVMN